MIEARTKVLKVIDFGLSKHLESAVTLGIGTPDYMAPELLNGAMLGGGAQDVQMQERSFKAAAADANGARALRVTWPTHLLTATRSPGERCSLARGGPMARTAGP